MKIFAFALLTCGSLIFLSVHLSTMGSLNESYDDEQEFM